MFIQLTGLSGVGKTTLALKVQQELLKLGYKCEVIDGDEYRQTLCKDLGFSKEDRVENIRRLSIMANLLVKNGVITIVSAINPYEEIRQENRLRYNAHTVWIYCDLPTLIKRDTKDLYRRAFLSEDNPEKIHNLTGVNDQFDIPNEFLFIDTSKTIEHSSKILLEYILRGINYNPIPKALFIGRWQPFHIGHEFLIDQKLSDGPVLIAVRNVLPDKNNPLSTEQTVELIKQVYKDNPLVSVMVIPDIESVNYGRGVGYQIIEHIPPDDVCKISGTEIRNHIRNNSDEWKNYVNPSIHNKLKEFYENIR